MAKQQEYDVYAVGESKLYDSYDWLLMARLPVIGIIFNLRRDALDRIEREAVNGQHCIIHGLRTSLWHYNSIAIRIPENK